MPLVYRRDKACGGYHGLLDSLVAPSCGVLQPEKWQPVRSRWIKLEIKSLICIVYDDVELSVCPKYVTL
jgi:hypothetical protein